VTVFEGGSVRGGASSLVFSAMDRKHRPRSHPVRRSMPQISEEEYYTRIGRRIRQLREARGWTQSELAALVGVTHVAVSQWETAAYRPSAWTVEVLEHLFGQQVRP
jgi:ribosome-binding protein aMBF1 (putative translation factor)